MQSLASLMETLEIFAYRTVTVVHFTGQNWISKTMYCIRCVMVCKICFTNWKGKIELLRASMIVICYIKLFRTGVDRHNGILMSLLFLVAETIKNCMFQKKGLLWKWKKINAYILRRKGNGNIFIIVRLPHGHSIVIASVNYNQSDS